MDANTLSSVLSATYAGDKAGIAQALLGCFFDRSRPWQDELDLYTLVLATRHATINGIFGGLRETLGRECVPVHHVPSPRNLARAFKTYGRRAPEDLELEVEFE